MLRRHGPRISIFCVVNVVNLESRQYVDAFKGRLRTIQSPGRVLFPIPNGLANRQNLNGFIRAVKNDQMVVDRIIPLTSVAPSAPSPRCLLLLGISYLIPGGGKLGKAHFLIGDPCGWLSRRRAAELALWVKALVAQKERWRQGMSVRLFGLETSNWNVSIFWLSYIAPISYAIHCGN